jgi:iron complex transport system ATP-binding protein
VTGRTLTPATAEQIAVARTATDALGLYFQLAHPTDQNPGDPSRTDRDPAGPDRDPAGPDPSPPGQTSGHPSEDHTGWRSVARLYEPGAGPLDELLDSVQARLGGCERRVAASLFYQGYAARLLSPQLGCIAIGGCVPAVPADQLRWREPATEMIQLGLPTGPGWQGPAEALLTQVLVQSFTAHLRPLATAIQARVHISADLLQDNAASALVSGVRLLDRRLAGDGWRPLAAVALAHPLLHGSGTLAPGTQAPDTQAPDTQAPDTQAPDTLNAGGPGFVRRSCCLYYRTQDGGLCGDCPLA